LGNFGGILTKKKTNDLESEDKILETENYGELTERLLTAERNAAEFEDKYLRVAAEFENFKKRQNRIFDEMISSAQDALLYRILGILDNFERALEHTNEPVDSEAVIEGIELIHKQMQDLLVAESIEEIYPMGECFDPNVHEAVCVMPSDEDEEKVLEVIQKGYKRGNRLVRPAKVVVGKPKTDIE